MYKHKKILGLIPARGGSKGLRKKNIRNMQGKPLIAWTVGQALSSRYLDEVMVNTDDPGIAAVGRRYGAKIPFMRPPALARDKSKVIDTVLHTLDFYEQRGIVFDYLALLEPTSPLRKKGDIDRAIKKLIDNQQRAESLISVGEIALEHPIYSKQITGNEMVQPYFKKGQGSSLRQELQSAYFPYGVIYLSKVAAIRKYQAVYPGKILALKIERWQNYEINDLFDFLCVETILKKMKGAIG
jgi:CMP-N-acetylneuraminic acid synthetase